jgi:hypothetical protein
MKCRKGFFTLIKLDDKGFTKIDNAHTRSKFDDQNWTIIFRNLEFWGKCIHCNSKVCTFKNPITNGYIWPFTFWLCDIVSAHRISWQWSPSLLNCMSRVPWDSLCLQIGPNFLKVSMQNAWCALTALSFTVRILPSRSDWFLFVIYQLGIAFNLCCILLNIFLTDKN